MPWTNMQPPPPYPKKVSGVKASRPHTYIPKYVPPHDSAGWKYMFATVCVILCGTLGIRLLLHADARTNFSWNSTWVVFLCCVLTYLAYKVIAQKDRMLRQDRQLSNLYRQINGIPPGGP
jgi:hypothetical protein